MNTLNHDSFGSAAFGKAGAFTVEVLCRSDDKLLLSVESPSWDFCFELVSPAIVDELAAFLRRYDGRTEFAELVLGSFSGASVWVIKDDEFEDRLCLRGFGGDGALVNFTLVGAATDDFVSAVCQAAEEFDPEG